VAVTSIGVVLVPPGVDDGLGVLKRVEPVGVEALLAEASVEASMIAFCVGVPG
jgi:hypothetical protein